MRCPDVVSYGLIPFRGLPGAVSWRLSCYTVRATRVTMWRVVLFGVTLYAVCVNYIVCTQRCGAVCVCRGSALSRRVVRWYCLVSNYMRGDAPW